MGEIDAGKMDGVENSELLEAHERAQACAARLAARMAGAREQPEPEPADRWLTPDEVEATCPTLKRRWLFANAERLSFVKRTSPRKILISEQGLKRWLSGRKVR
jgi:hypothetical protein